MESGLTVNVLCRTLAEMAAATSVHVVAVIEPIIQHADWFFPEGNVTFRLHALPKQYNDGIENFLKKKMLQ